MRIHLLAFTFCFVSPALAGELPVAPLYEGLEPIGPTVHRDSSDFWKRERERIAEKREREARLIDFETFRKNSWILGRIPRNFSYLDRTTAHDRVRFVLAWREGAEAAFSKLDKTPADKLTIAEEQDFARKWFKENHILFGGNDVENARDERFILEAILDASEFCFRQRPLNKSSDFYGFGEAAVLPREHEQHQAEVLKLLGFKLDESGNPVGGSSNSTVTAKRSETATKAVRSLSTGGDFSFRDTKNVLILLDCSVGTLDASKNLVSQLVAKMPNALNCGLRIFGQNSGDSKLCCQSSELLCSVSSRPQELLRFIPDIRPGGHLSNVAFALRMALEKDFSGLTGKSVVVLLSDGEDTCGESLLSQLYVSRANGFVVPIVGISTGLRWSYYGKNVSPLAHLAESTNGRYYDCDTYKDCIQDIESIGKK